MTDKKTKECEIEVLREQLHAIVAEHEGNLKHPGVMIVSAQLDELIVRCQRAKQ